jgi:hypothetical protein
MRSLLVRLFQIYHPQPAIVSNRTRKLRYTERRQDHSRLITTPASLALSPKLRKYFFTLTSLLINSSKHDRLAVGFGKLLEGVCEAVYKWVFCWMFVEARHGTKKNVGVDGFEVWTKGKKLVRSGENL